MSEPLIVNAVDPPHSLAEYVEQTVRGALDEDIGTGDLTAALVPAKNWLTAQVITRQDCIVCGEPWVTEVFRQIDPSVEIIWQTSEGASASSGEQLCELFGPARALLTGERTALNFLQLLSATATATRAYVDAVRGTRATILDTRKTLPGLRLAQKYAVRTGGAQNHRIGLFDAILIKENHITAAGGIAAAVANATDGHPGVMIEVEVENFEQLEAGLASGAHRLLLDNFAPADMTRAVGMRDETNADIELEASGSITLETIHRVAETGVDFISVGALTKDVQAVDLSMRLVDSA